MSFLIAAATIAMLAKRRTRLSAEAGDNAERPDREQDILRFAQQLSALMRFGANL